MDHEMESFQKDLLASVRQMKPAKAARTTEEKLSAASRAKVGVSQSAFAELVGVSQRTLRGASQHPEALRDLQVI